ncbi:hypothetical protein GCM10023149_18750 [Mucilaginibacter gynuensis]|uniref:Transglycosylase SLT domain-containing protein n=1 Tax=Mucilaginibacter gynuensis TaxID=1302236 RepID=A0ABP8G8Z1_9SPHI
MLQAQNLPGNSADIKTADSLFKIKSYNRSAEYYLRSFAQSPATRTNINLLNAAKACTNNQQVDSAFAFLSVIVSRKPRTFYNAIVHEAEFIQLWHDKRWQPLLAQMEKAKKRFNASVPYELESLRKERMRMDLTRIDLARKFGTNSNEYKLYQDTVVAKDAVNALKLKSIIHTYGWPGPEEIDDNGVESLIYLYLKLNFADQKRYYPLISTAFKKGNIDAENYAIITDRISFTDKGIQIYGTRPGDPVINKDSLNYRRLAIGLNPVE